jgi:hypothetical protein
MMVETLADKDERFARLLDAEELIKPVVENNLKNF